MTKNPILLGLAWLLALPAPALLAPGLAAAADLQSTTVPGRAPASLTNGEIAINRADKRLVFKNVDGTFGYGSLLNAIAAGRKVVETGVGDDVTVSGRTLSDRLADVAAKLDASKNLSDLTNAAAARTALGLGSTSTPTFQGASITGGTLELSGPAGAYRLQAYRTAGFNRFVFGLDNGAESGSNAGSDFFVGRNADDGSYLDTSIGIRRSDGQITLRGASLLFNSVPVFTTTSDASPLKVDGRALTDRFADTISLKDWTAKGDGSRATNRAQMQAAFDLAWATGKNVTIPCGVYYTVGTVQTYGVGWKGEASGCVILQKVDNTPMFQSTSQGFYIQGRTWGGITCRFEVPTGNDYSNTACFLISGGNDTFVQDNVFTDMMNQGGYALISVDKANADGPFGHESRVSVNKFDHMRGAGSVTNPAMYRFWFKTGSGTANVFSQMSGGSEGSFGNRPQDPNAAVFRFNGRDANNNSNVVGDIGFVDSQFQGPAQVALVTEGSIYNNNINWAGSQFDGNGCAIKFTNPAAPVSAQRMIDVNIGGSITLAPCLGPADTSVILDRDTDYRAGGVKKNPTSSRDYFRIGIYTPTAGYTATTCTFTFQGIIGNYGLGYAEVKYAFARQGGSATVTPILTQSTYINNVNAIVTSGAPLTTTTTATAPATANAVSYAKIGVAFTNNGGGNEIEGQYHCSGGSYTMERIPG